jgi:hypothetical protein
MLVVFERKRPGPQQYVAAVSNTSQDSKHCLGFSTDPFLALVIEETVETA